MSELMKTGSVIDCRGDRYLIIDHEAGTKDPQPGDQVLDLGSIVLAYDLTIIDVRLVGDEKVSGDRTFYRDGFPVARKLVLVPNSTRDFSTWLKNPKIMAVVSKLVEGALAVDTENPMDHLDEMAMHLHLAGFGVLNLYGGTYLHGVISTSEQDDAVRVRLSRCS